MKFHTEYLHIIRKNGLKSFRLQAQIPVTNGRLDFGLWQQVFYAEFDGRRNKRVVIKVMGE